jgi:hypothetical protein
MGVRRTDANLSSTFLFGRSLTCPSFLIYK